VKRSEFEHAVRAAGAILDEGEILVIGSQAIHASLEDVPDASMRSVEVDIVALDDTDGSKSDLVDGSIGEASLFHQTFGYYAQGVSMETAVLPTGWRDRLVRFETPATEGVVAWCLDPADLWISKAVAGRPKDLEFCRALLRMGMVDTSVLLDRLAVTDAVAEKLEVARALLSNS
jgi:hypothetical protein